MNIFRSIVFPAKGLLMISQCVLSSCFVFQPVCPIFVLKRQALAEARRSANAILKSQPMLFLKQSDPFWC